MPNRHGMCRSIADELIQKCFFYVKSVDGLFSKTAFLCQTRYLFLLLVWFQLFFEQRVPKPCQVPLNSYQEKNHAHYKNQRKVSYMPATVDIKGGF